MPARKQAALNLLSSQLRATGAYTKQWLRDKLFDHKAYVDEHGEDLPEIENWKWTIPATPDKV